MHKNATGSKPEKNASNDRKTTAYAVGNLVLLHVKTLAPDESAKFRLPYLGPYVITKISQSGRVAYLSLFGPLARLNSPQIAHISRLKPCIDADYLKPSELSVSSSTSSPTTVNNPATRPASPVLSSVPTTAPSLSTLPLRRSSRVRRQTNRLQL